MSGVPVLVTAPSVADHARVLRVVAGYVAAQAGLTVDALDDLGLAIDESCGALLAFAGGTAWECAIAAEGGDLEVRIRAMGGDRAAWPPPGWSETLQGIVLGAVTDEVEPLFDAGEPAVRFTVKR